jgi:polyferredoxin
MMNGEKMIEKRRQKIRKSVQIISLILFPVTFYYFSPYLIIDGASQGIVTGSFLMFALLFATALVGGRVFCGWLCPAGGLQRVCCKINNKNFKVGKRDWIKYFIWVPWIAVIVLLFIRAGRIQSIDPLYQTYYGISVSDVYSLVLFLVIAGAIALISVIAGKRGSCHSVCWMAPFMIIGRTIRNIGKWPSLRLKAGVENCIDCKTCSRNCPMSLDVNEMVKRGAMEHTECILCGTCVDTCPKEVISYSFTSGTK